MQAVRYVCIEKQVFAVMVTSSLVGYIIELLAQVVENCCSVTGSIHVWSIIVVTSDVAIIADNRLSIAERLRLRWSIILFNNRLSPTSPRPRKAKNAKHRIVLSMKQNAGRVGFKWTMASVTSPIRPNIQCGPSSYFKYMTNRDLVLMVKSLFLLLKGSFT